MPGRGHFPAQPLLGSGAAGRSRRTLDELGAAPRGARGAAAAMCRRGSPPRAPSPRPVPAPPGTEGGFQRSPGSSRPDGSGDQGRGGKGQAERRYRFAEHFSLLPPLPPSLAPSPLSSAFPVWFCQRKPQAAQEDDSAWKGQRRQPSSRLLVALLVPAACPGVPATVCLACPWPFALALSPSAVSRAAHPQIQIRAELS